MIDRKKFFTTVRQSVFHGHMRQKQVDGINIILDTWGASVFIDMRWLAYMLGTAFHETGATMQPIKEYGNLAYFTRMYDVQGKRPDVAKRMGNTKPGDGARYCGRGFVQLTWQINYKRAGYVLGIDLVNNPDLALVPDVAARIMFEGMTDATMIFEDHTSIAPSFSFTGRTLEQYFNDSREDWISARRVINGLYHAAVIAETAQDFYAALQEERG